MNAKEKVKKEPTLLLALTPVVLTVIILIFSVSVLKVDVQVPLILGTCITAFIAIVFLGYTWQDLEDGAVESLKSIMQAVLLLIIIGATIGTWIVGGVVPALVYYGLQILTPAFFLVACMILCSIVSLAAGGSWATVGTIGIALVGIAKGLDIPVGLAGGAIISGAYFGDKMSPLSDTTNLAPIAAGGKLYDHIQHMFWTTGPGFIICCIVYTIVGFTFGGDLAAAGTPEKVTIIFETLSQIFKFNPLIILPPLIVLYGSIAKKPTIPIMLASSAVAIFNAVTFQNFSLQDCFTAAISGFNMDMIHVAGFTTEGLIEDIPKLLQRGGMISMLNTVLIAFCAYGFAGTLAVTGSLNIVLNKLMTIVKSTGGLIVSTIISCITAVFVTSNGQLSILIPGEMFKDTYLKKGLEPRNLSRTLEDSATVVEPITPWTAAGVYMATTLGVSTLEYLPWAIICYTGVIFAVIWGFTGIGIKKITKDSEYYDEYVALNKADGIDVE